MQSRADAAVGLDGAPRDGDVSLPDVDEPVLVAPARHIEAERPRELLQQRLVASPAELGEKLSDRVGRSLPHAGNLAMVDENGVVRRG